MSDHPHTPLDTDRACVRCSYNLRGLPTDGVCPECGTPVADSLRGYYLAFAAPKYLAALADGLGLVLAGIPVYATVLLGGAAATFTLGGRFNQALIGTLCRLALLVPTALLLIGYWRFTRPDPGLTARESWTSVRRVIRASVVVQAAAAGAGVLAVAGGPGGVGPVGLRGALGTLSTLLDLGALAAWTAQFFATMAYVGWLGQRVPDRFIVDRSGFYTWALPLVFVFGAVTLLIGPVMAVGLYWTLLDRLRRQVRSIRRTGMPARFG